MVTAALPGGQMVAPYGQPYLQPYMPVRRRNNSLAVAFLLCALAQPFMGVTTIPAIILGHIARGQIRRTREYGDGLRTPVLLLAPVWLSVTILLPLLTAPPS